MMLAEGNTVLMTSGRQTTPFPKVDIQSERRALKTVRRLHAWLVENAVAEAEVRKDHFNGVMFRALVPEKLTDADVCSINLYLFGNNF